MSTVRSQLPLNPTPLIRRMLDKITAFQALLLEEQDAIRSLSFGQFTSVTMRKTQLLDEIRELEQQRRTKSACSEDSSWRRPPPMYGEADLVAAIGRDRSAESVQCRAHRAVARVFARQRFGSGSAHRSRRHSIRPPVPRSRRPGGRVRAKG